MTHDTCFQKTVTFENGDGSKRGGRDCGLVWGHTFSSSSKRPCDKCLGWFKTSEHFNMCHVSYRMCAKIHVLYRVKVHCGSWYHMQCTDVMGVIAEQCAIIAICSVKLRAQAWRAFQIKRRRGQMHLDGIYIHHTSNNTRIHANHVREYQSQLWSNFSSLRTSQRSLFQRAAVHNIVHGVLFTI